MDTPGRKKSGPSPTVVIDAPGATLRIVADPEEHSVAWVVIGHADPEGVDGVVGVHMRGTHGPREPRSGSRGSRRGLAHSGRHGGGAVTPRHRCRVGVERPVSVNIVAESATDDPSLAAELPTDTAAAAFATVTEKESQSTPLSSSVTHTWTVYTALSA